MSKVKFLIEEEFICTCLEYIRKMHETRDYSGLLAVVERIQQHANAMEAGLGNRWFLESILYDEKLSDSQKVEKLKDRFRKED